MPNFRLSYFNYALKYELYLVSVSKNNKYPNIDQIGDFSIKKGYLVNLGTSGQSAYGIYMNSSLRSNRLTNKFDFYQPMEQVYFSKYQSTTLIIYELFVY